jgi:polyhydroxybutyrate depolymerase
MHGYASDAPDIEESFQLDTLAQELGFFALYPRGTVDSDGHRFFNATDACCDFFGSHVDDVAFIDSLIDHVEAEYAIDPTRVYAVGYSNGGFMSFRLACDLSARIAGVVSLEGAMWKDASRCRPSSPVAVLEVHGSADPTISPDGGVGVDGFAGYVYPSVAETMQDWAGFDACNATTTTASSPGMLDSNAAGPAEAERWEGCRAAVEHWTVPGGAHAPSTTALWPRAIFTFLSGQAKQPPVAITTAP